jgi:CBS domain containing-hemolysin-like protein
MDRRIKKLNLSESQGMKYEEIRSKVQANMTKARHERERLFEALKTEINDGNPDIDTIAGLLKNCLKSFSPIMEENIDYFSDFYKILDEEQRAKVLKKLRKKLKRL